MNAKQQPVCTMPERWPKHYVRSASAGGIADACDWHEAHMPSRQPGCFGSLAGQVASKGTNSAMARDEPARRTAVLMSQTCAPGSRSLLSPGNRITSGHPGWADPCARICAADRRADEVRVVLDRGCFGRALCCRRGVPRLEFLRVQSPIYFWHQCAPTQRVKGGAVSGETLCQAFVRAMRVQIRECA